MEPEPARADPSPHTAAADAQLEEAAGPSPAPERSDEEIAAEEVGGEVIVLIRAAAWRKVAAMPGLPAFLLDEAERGGRQAVLAILARFGIGAGQPP